jgi:hypothetical protein
MQSMQTIYPPLDKKRSEIRLVEILSIDGDEKVQCRLSISSLEDNPTFTALSYVWGDPKVTEDIMLNDELFPGTTNLGAALKYVKAHWCSSFPDRSPGHFRLWVDAICINQKDQNERSSQVDLMREIYSKAELVLSWLGHGIDEIDIAFEALKAIAKETGELGSEEAGDEWLKSYPTWWAKPAEIWDAIRSFFRLPYWHRVWVFQELVLGNHILFLHGSTTLTYEDLNGATSWLSLIQILIGSGRIKKPSFLSREIWILLSVNVFSIAAPVRVNIYKKRELEDDP